MNFSQLISQIANHMAICESYVRPRWKDGCPVADVKHPDGIFESYGDKRFKVKYRGCHKGYSPESDDPQVDTVYELTMPEILHEINRDRGRDWIDFDETNWREGLDNWTFFEPVDDVRTTV